MSRVPRVPAWKSRVLRTGDRELGPLASGTFGGGMRWLIGRDTRPDAWSLVFQTDVATTAFSDALFIQNRQSFFNALRARGKVLMRARVLSYRSGCLRGVARGRLR